MDINKETLKKLQCANCDLLLSVGPVKINEDKTFVCGRCYNEGLPVNTIYEALAQQFLFPCRYQAYGCKNTLKWGSVKEHEDSCPSKPYNCPATIQCKWLGVVADITKHFKESHQEDYISESNKIEIKLNEEKMFSKVFETEQTNYILNLKINENKLFLSLHQLISLDKFKKHRYELKLYAHDTQKHLMLGPIEVESYCSLNNPTDMKNNVVDIGVLKFLNDESSLIICQIMTSTKPPDVTELLTLLECPICKEFMDSSIHLCETGHSFCNGCINSILNDYCPLCDSGFLGARNYLLEDLINIVGDTWKNSALGYM